MRLAVLATYPPRACGIATFSADLREALLSTPGVEAVEIFAIVRDESEQQAPEVAFTIRQNEIGDYIKAADLVGALDIDLVLIQHEYGIFGGSEGDHVLAFVDALTVPAVTTLHTVLSAPTPKRAAVLEQLCGKSALTIVMTETAERLLVHNNICKPDWIRVVPHGAPEELFHLPPSAEAKKELGIAPDRFVLSTFGLISDGKGLEMGIDAIAEVASEHPEVLFVIAGRTHPDIVARDGEVYRESLISRIESLGISDHIQFENHYLTDANLATILAATDLYITPYKGREQIVSGALTFAIAAGRPVVSTPYFYAEDLLSSGAGDLVPFNNPGALAAAINRLIDTPELLAARKAEAHSVGSNLSWKAVGEATVRVLDEAKLQSITRPRPGTKHLSAIGRSSSMPLTHLRSLIDDIGIIQHASYAIPNRSTGYCVDDVGRLAVVAMRILERITMTPPQNSENLVLASSGASFEFWSRVRTQCLAYLVDAYVPGERGLRNFAAFDGHWLDDPQTGDHVGRAVWGIGAIAALDDNPDLYEPAIALIENLSDALLGDRFLRPGMYALLGLSMIPASRDTDIMLNMREVLTQKLVDAYTKTADDEWAWFENALSYDNARLAQALIVAGARDENLEASTIGLTALHWLYNESRDSYGTLHHIGCEGRKRGEDRPGKGDEQPIDAAALTEAYGAAFTATQNPLYADRAIESFAWFIGNNHLGIPVGNLLTGACHDGLTATDVNRNQGAESTLAFVHAALDLNERGINIPVRVDVRSIK